MKRTCSRLNDLASRLPRRTVFLISLLILVAVFWIDAGTRWDFNFLLFYLMPVALAGWYGGDQLALGTPLLALGFWLVAQALRDGTLAPSFLGFWNAFSHFVVFALVAATLHGWNQTMHREKNLSRRDPLTGLLNRRGFYEKARRIVAEANETGPTLTFACIDVDNFRLINDSMGDSIGDALLSSIGSTIAMSTRQVDAVGRMGGDEFVLLVSQMGSSPARRWMEELREDLRRIAERFRWPVTFSIGVLTFETLPDGAREMVAIVENLMSRINDNGKDSLAFYAYQTSVLPWDGEVANGTPAEPVA